MKTIFIVLMMVLMACSSLGCGSHSVNDAASKVKVLPCTNNLEVAVRGPNLPPNVILILADDLGWRDTAIYGSAYYETPHIDRLAGLGARLTQAYSASPLCSPSRAAIHAASYAHRFGMTAPFGHIDLGDDVTPFLEGEVWQRQLMPRSTDRMPLDQIGMGQWMSDRGYVTSLIGKWHLNDGEYAPQSYGYQTVIGGTSDARTSYFPPFQLAGVRARGADDYLTDALACRAVEFINEHKNRAFFMQFNPFSVHGPFQARPAWIRHFQQKDNFQGRRQSSPVMAAMIASLDQSLGLILDALEETSLLNDTIIIFTSDNGGNIYSRINNSKFATSNFPLRGGKGSPYEGGVRVPLMLAWPGTITAGQVIETPVSGIDLAPTIIELCGLDDIQDSIDGVSFAKILRGQSMPQRDFFWYFPHYLPFTHSWPCVAVRHGPYKCYRFYDGPDGEMRHELYHLPSDIGEQRDISLSLPDLVDCLDQLMQDHLDDTGHLQPIPNPDYDPDAQHSYAPHQDG